MTATGLDSAHQPYLCQHQLPLHCSPHFLLRRSRFTTLQGKTIGLLEGTAGTMPIRGCVSMPTDNLHGWLCTDARWVAAKERDVATKLPHLQVVPQPAVSDRCGGYIELNG